MKQQQVWFVCDYEGCDEDSPPEVSWTLARKTAKDLGWTFIGGDTSFCPEHGVSHG